MQWLHDWSNLVTWAFIGINHLEAPELKRHLDPFAENS